MMKLAKIDRIGSKRLVVVSRSLTIERAWQLADTAPGLPWTMRSHGMPKAAAATVAFSGMRADREREVVVLPLAIDIAKVDPETVWDRLFARLPGTVSGFEEEAQRLLEDKRFERIEYSWLNGWWTYEAPGHDAWEATQGNVSCGFRWAYAEDAVSSALRACDETYPLDWTAVRFHPQPDVPFDGRDQIARDDTLQRARLDALNGRVTL